MAHTNSATLIQLLLIGFLVAQVVLVIAGLIHVRRQGLPERDLLLWDLIVIFVPLGGLMALLYFQTNQKNDAG